VFGLVLDGTEITGVKHECLAIYVKFKSLKAWIAFFERYLSLQIKKAFDPLQEEIRRQKGFEQVELAVVVYEEDFLQGVNDIGKYFVVDAISCVTNTHSRSCYNY